MKARVLAVIVCVMAVVNVASAGFANGINFLSQEYSASGEFSASIFEGWEGNYPEGYPIWGGVGHSCYFPPQSDPINYDYEYYYAYTAPWGDSGFAGGVISLNSGHLYVGTTGEASLSDWGGWSASVNAYTMGSWDFQPQYSNMELLFNVDGHASHAYSVGSISLSDLTTGSLLLNVPAINPYFWEELNNNPFYSVDPTHTYKLTLFTRGNGINTEGPCSGRIEAVMSSVPAPGAVVLGSIGVGLVGWLRRRRTL